MRCPYCRQDLTTPKHPDVASRCAARHYSDARNRTIPATVEDRIPIVPAPGTGVVVPSCEQRGPRYPVTRHAGCMLRVGGDAYLCFDCGPEGGVYHPEANREAESRAEGYTGPPMSTMDDCKRIAETITLHDGDGSVPPTAGELHAFEIEMRRGFGMEAGS